MKKVASLLLASIALFSTTAVQAAQDSQSMNNPNSTAPSYDTKDNQGWSRSTSAVKSNPDHEMTKKIYDKIKNDRALSDDSKRDIQVTIYNGKVTLEGTVKNKDEKSRVEFLAKQIDGVNDISNKLTIAGK